MGPGQYQVGWSQFEVYQRPDGRMAVRDITGWDGTDQITQLVPHLLPLLPPMAASAVGSTRPLTQCSRARALASLQAFFRAWSVCSAWLAVGGGGHHGGGIGVLGGALLAGAGATGVYVSATYKEPTAKAA